MIVDWSKEKHLILMRLSPVFLIGLEVMRLCSSCSSFHYVSQIICLFFNDEKFFLEIFVSFHNFIFSDAFWWFFTNFV